jgi:malate dehydrogenase
MNEVAIIGAGELGGAIAHVLARRDLAHRIKLIDAAGQVAAGQALDIMQASPIERFSTRVSGSTDVAAAAGASMVVVADRHGAGEWTGDDGFLLMKELAGLAKRASFICAGPAQRVLVERSALEVGLPRARVIGSAPEALVSAIRAITALETNGSPRDVSLALLGVPPDHVVVDWEEATIAGAPATRVLDEPARRRIAARVPALWPPGPYALANAAADVASALLEHTRRVVSVFVAPEREGGRRTRTVALPVRLDRGGIASIELAPLTVQAQVALDNAMLL